MRRNSRDQGSPFLAAAVLAAVGLPALTGLWQRALTVFFDLSAAVLTCPDRLFSGKERKARPPAGLTLEEARYKAAEAGRRWLIFLVPGQTVLGFYLLATGKRRFFKRKIDFMGLIKIKSAFTPCLRPIIKTGPISKMPATHGDWAYARTPIGLALENLAYLDARKKPVPPEVLLNPQTGLIWKDRKVEIPPGAGLDREAMRPVLAGQLGPRLTDIKKDLDSFWRDLAAAFWTQTLGDKETAGRILDELCCSWKPETKHAFSKTAVKVWPRLDPRKLPGDVRIHTSFRNVFLMALLNGARKKGILPSPRFLWLRPTDRALFYSLNQLGSKMAWAEAVGPWSHYLAEKRLDRTLQGASLEAGLTGYRKALAKEGWLPAAPRRTTGPPARDDSRTPDSGRCQDDIEIDPAHPAGAGKNARLLARLFNEPVKASPEPPAAPAGPGFRSCARKPGRSLRTGFL
jgi:hypothetical protein